jgi:hypothetical protein
MDQKACSGLFQKLLINRDASKPKLFRHANKERADGERARPLLALLDAFLARSEKPSEREGATKGMIED